MDIFTKFILTMLCLFFISFLIVGFYHSGYKSGQINAINGNINYELKKQKDNSFVWEKIQK
jgi:hypothetical protein